uniref:Actin-related protein 4 n=1 Tax=Hirondellea gigas TaxID=1518452 RepID=A0A6A7G159_9CRUS
MQLGDDVGALVVDIGSGFTKCGYAGDDAPKALFSSAVGVGETDEKDGDVSMTSSKQEQRSREYYCGQQLEVRRDNINIEYPVKHGLVEDWDGFDRLLDFGFKDTLKLDTADHSILVTESTFNTDKRREKIIEHMFEHLHCPATFLVKDSVLTAFSVGRHTSLILDSGSGITTIVPVQNGYALIAASRRTKVAGDYINEMVEKAIVTSGQSKIRPIYSLKKQTVAGKVMSENLDFPKTTSSYHRHYQLDVIRNIKEEICEVSQIKLPSTRKPDTKSYELPDGNRITLGPERLLSTEVMFVPPAELGEDLDPNFKFQGLGHMVVDSVMASDPDIRKDLFMAVVLSGGNTRFNGFAQRIHSEIMRRLPPALSKLKVIQPVTSVERRFGAWIGGSILASLGSFQHLWISKEEYTEHGPGIVHDKCP